MCSPNINMLFEIYEKLCDEIPDPIWGSHSASWILLRSQFLHRNHYKNHYKKSAQGRAVNDTAELKACHLSIALGKFILFKIVGFVSYDVIISSLTVGNRGFVIPSLAIQQVTQIPMKCLISPHGYFGAARLPLVWINTQSMMSKESWWDTAVRQPCRQRWAGGCRPWLCQAALPTNWVTDILDSLCWDCSQTSLVGP